jgi:hypothetical protein
MNIDLKNTTLSALLSVLKPLAKMLLRAGVSYKEFDEVAKTAFVDEASKGYGLRGRDTNMSRVAIMTGLSRREVGRIRKVLQSDMAVGLEIVNPASEILGQWFADERFCDSSGNPRVLPLEDEEGSFPHLVKLYAGDIPWGAMKTELLRVGAIEQNSENSVRILNRHYTPAGLNERLAMSLVEIIRPALLTLAHNCNSNREGPLHYQRVMGAIGVDPSLIPVVRSILIDRLNDVGEGLDGLVSAYVPKADEPRSNLEAGVGLYYYEIEREN